MLDLELGMIDVTLVLTLHLVRDRGVASKVVDAGDNCHGQQCCVPPCENLPSFTNEAGGGITNCTLCAR